MVCKPHHSLMKVYLITTSAKCLTLYVYYILAVCYHAQSKWEERKLGKGGKVAIYMSGKCRTFLLNFVCLPKSVNVRQCVNVPF